MLRTMDPTTLTENKAQNAMSQPVTPTQPLPLCPGVDALSALSRSCGIETLEALEVLKTNAEAALPHCSLDQI